MKRTPLQLRCLVRVSEARIEHLTAAIRGGDYPAPMHLRPALQQAHANLAIYAAELAALNLSPAPHAATTTSVLAGHLVTSAAAEPATPS